MKIENPILKGFNPDPSILRVNDDYFIATSTFEWFPGVQIHQSKDLIHWKLITRPLNRISQLDLAGVPDSCGVWAPCLSYDDGIFYLIYTIVRGYGGGCLITHNYMVTASDILGDWSERIFLNSSGFDPSLFHDSDGRKWLVNMSCDYGKGREWFGGILLQEYSAVEKKLVGPVRSIFRGTEIGKTEGPHLYKINGYYYLLTAEGGTGLEHAVTIARSKSIYGPYEVDPQNPILTSQKNPFLPLQKAGHASIVDTQGGETYMVHLCGRPLPSRGVCTLGRETGIQKMDWTDDQWLRLEDGGNEPFLEAAAPCLPLHEWAKERAIEGFDSETLNINFQSPRIKLGSDMLSLTERPGFLRLYGMESLSSAFCQSLVARRQQAFCYTASTCMEFEPENFKQMAGLTCYYNTQNYHYLYVSHDAELGKHLGIITCDNNISRFPLQEEVSIEGWIRCCLKAEVYYDRMRFYYSPDGETWTGVGPELDMCILSDEHNVWWGFTGAFVGVCCQDLSGLKKYADFDYFVYQEM